MIDSSFLRLRNPDSTADVICLNCFQTVARSQEHIDLIAAESDHTCDPRDLVLLRYGSSSVAQRNTSNSELMGMS